MSQPQAVVIEPVSVRCPLMPLVTVWAVMNAVNETGKKNETKQKSNLRIKGYSKAGKVRMGNRRRKGVISNKTTASEQVQLNSWQTPLNEVYGLIGEAQRIVVQQEHSALFLSFYLCDDFLLL